MHLLLLLSFPPAIFGNVMYCDKSDRKGTSVHKGLHRVSETRWATHHSQIPVVLQIMALTWKSFMWFIIQERLGQLWSASSQSICILYNCTFLSVSPVCHIIFTQFTHSDTFLLCISMLKISSKYTHILITNRSNLINDILLHCNHKAAHTVCTLDKQDPWVL